MRKVFFIIFLITVAGTLRAQYNETIRTARPGQSIGPFTVGRSVFQVQTGVDIYGSKNEDVQEKSFGVLHNAVIRYGLAERFEISTLINYGSNTVDVQGNETKSSGLDGFDIGGRYHVLSGDGLKPNIGLQVRFRLPILSEDYKIENVAPRFTLSTTQKLSDTFTLCTNWGGSWNGNYSAFTGIYTINVAYPFTEKLGSYVENYGSITGGVFQTRWDTGVGYLVTNNLQLDCYGGFGSNQGVKDWFVSVGLSWRTKLK